MFRTTDVILVGVMVAAAAVTFKIKYDAELKYEEVRRLETEIHTERDTIDILEADLSVLTQPARLQTLVDAYAEELQLQSVEPDQIGSVDRLPETLRQIGEIVSARPVEEAITDDVQTGAVSQ
ncbi:MAG: hypothetical protein JJ864_13970 [Rhizobiaceae bacterium]|nr:hypothetical protein [Rhizobiaceae bacterium]